MFEIDPDEVLAVSAKQGIGVKDLLDCVVQKIPPPTTLGEKQKIKKMLYRENIIYILLLFKPSKSYFLGITLLRVRLIPFC